MWHSKQNTINVPIYPKTINISKKVIKPLNWDKNRLNVIKQCDSICIYCGGKYKKYLYCIHLDGDPNNFESDNINIACKLCYMITNINYFTNSGQLILMYSKISQIDIVRKTIDNIIKFGSVPTFDSIDPDVEIPEISLVEYITIICNYKKTKINVDFTNYKIFFTDSLDGRFIDSLFLYDDSESLFSDSEQTMSYDDIPKKIYKINKMSNANKITINNYFNNINAHPEIQQSISHDLNEQLMKNFNTSQLDKIKFMETNMKYILSKQSKDRFALFSSFHSH